MSDTEKTKDTPEQQPESSNNAAEPATEAGTTVVADAAATTAEEPTPVENPEMESQQEEAAKQQAVEEALPAEEIAIPELRSGMTVRIYQKIKEGEKERVQIFQGIITALRGKTPVTKTVTVEKTSFGVVVEKIFPLASPMIEKIQVVKKAAVRRSKLYFLREYSKRLKETVVR